MANLSLFQTSCVTNHLELRKRRTTTTTATRQLPATYRVAAADQCRNVKSTKFSKASNDPKVSLEDQREFAHGGYTKRARGSGDVNAVGPIVNMLSQIQHGKGIYASIAELGVHHGRFTGFLFVTARSTEKLIVADLFEQQDKNVDKSGLGDKKRFLKGLQTYALGEQDVHTLFTGSTDELAFDWPDQAGFEPFRMISVDASHTAELTFNDLQLAFCNLVLGGVVILDDWFHSMWPGVVEGYYQFVDHGPTQDVYPFLICESKLFVTNDKDFHKRYYDSLKNDKDLANVLSPYAHEKERGKLLYEMNGVNYLKCQSRQNMTVARLQELWAEKVY
jgi:hypothetical protein